MRNIALLWQSFGMVIKNILGNSFRSFLTCLGIIIGVASVIGMVSIISVNGDIFLKDAVTRGLGEIEVYDYGNALRSGISDEDVTYFKTLDGVKGCSREFSFSDYYAQANGHMAKKVNLDSREADYFKYHHQVEIVKGRGISKADEVNGTYVCVINTRLANILFPDKDPVGENLVIAGLMFKVVGVVKITVDLWGYGAKQEVYIPIPIMKAITGETGCMTVSLYLEDPFSAALTYEAVEGYMSKIYEHAIDENYYVFYEGDSIAQCQEEQKKAAVQTMIIAGISLLVGGIGIMNMMLVSVTERTREIGLRKAMGATPIRIQFQFLLESIILSSVGGSIGLLIGVSVSIIYCKFIGYPPTVNGMSAVAGVVFSLLVGVLFGWAPAKKASELNPIDALKSE